MTEKLTQEMVWGFIQLGDADFDLESLRARYQISAESSAFYTAINRLLAEKKIKRLGRGRYHKVKKVERVDVFGVPRERKEPIPLIFPKDREYEMEFPFAESITMRQGDLILIAGLSNYGKTTLALNFLAENLDLRPVIMGNEYTDENDAPKQRFLNRLDAMRWVEWTNGNGDRFDLLPVQEDFEDYIVKDRINIIDWIDIETDFWDIKNISKRLKRAVQNGLVIAVIQKNEGREAGVGGGMTKYYTDLELLVDRHTQYESRLTVGKVKEYSSHVSGRSWAFSISGQGTHITNIHEVALCSQCHGFKYIKGTGACPTCHAVGWVDL